VIDKRCLLKQTNPAEAFNIFKMAAIIKDSAPVGAVEDDEPKQQLFTSVMKGSPLSPANILIDEVERNVEIPNLATRRIARH